MQERAETILYRQQQPIYSSVREMEVDSRSLDAFTSSPVSGQLCLSVGDLNGCVPGMNTVHQRDVFSGSA